MTAIVATSVLTALVVAAGPADFESRVDRAIERGVKYLRAKMEAAPWSAHPDKAYPMGHAAIEVYALLKSDIPVYDPVVYEALKYLEGLRPIKTYSVSLYLMALDAALSQLETDAALARGKPVDRIRVSGPLSTRLRKRLAEMASWLLKARQKGYGRWNYVPSGPGTRYDNSNTQFAVLALGVAARRGFRIPPSVWDEIATHFLADQAKKGPRVDVNVAFRKDIPASKARTTAARRKIGIEKPPEVHARGWGYMDKGEKLTMTAAGLSSLILAREYLLQAKAVRPDRLRQINQAIWDGLAWLARNGLRYGNWFYYALYSVEKVGDLGAIEKIGNIDWYRHGAEIILKNQHPNGSWGKNDRRDKDNRYQTSFALLFLNRATDLLVHSRPIFITGKGSTSKPRAGWIRVSRLGGEVSISRMFRKLKYNPQRSMLRIGEAMVKDAIRTGRAPELIPYLIGLADSPYKRVVKFAKDSLTKITGEDLEDLSLYRKWAETWAFVIQAGRKQDRSAVPKLRELLRTSKSIALKREILAALERMRAIEAVPDLLDELESPDKEYRARVYSALKFITFQRLPFSPNASASVRSKQIAAWRAWWEQNKAKYLKSK